MMKNIMLQRRNQDLRHETRQHVAVKVWWMDLQSCWECSSTCYTPIHCQTTTIQQPTCCYTPTWWPNIAWKSAGNRDFFHWYIDYQGICSLIWFLQWIFKYVISLRLQL